MKALILGGTRFIGRHIVLTLLAAGHSVSILTRGESLDELPADVQRLRGDRDQGTPGLEALKGRAWDVCIDVSGYTATHMRSSAELLCEKVHRYVLISAVSVYGDPQDRPVSETHPRLPPAGEDVTDINRETYGPLKVTCENIVQEVYAGRCAVLRPQIVVGSHDPSGRYSYWVQRAMQSGEMLAPGDGSDHLQVIDVRDVASFIRTTIENELCGIFNLAGPRISWAQFIKILGSSNVAWVDAEIIKGAGVTESELPLFRSERGERSGLMDVNNEAARNAGLVLTEPEITMRQVRGSIAGKNLTPALSPGTEKKLIRLSKTRSRSSRACP
jgi:2'-hydroxyisoflavone reductase